MLVRFKSEVGGFVMFGEVAQKLLRMTGHSGTVPGAIAAEQMRQALERLEAQVLAQAQPENEASVSADSDEGNSADSNGVERSVSLAQRAFPLIELMRRAAAESCAIQWHKD